MLHFLVLFWIFLFDWKYAECSQYICICICDGKLGTVHLFILLSTHSISKLSMWDQLFLRKMERSNSGLLKFFSFPDRSKQLKHSERSEVSEQNLSALSFLQIGVIISPIQIVFFALGECLVGKLSLIVRIRDLSSIFVTFNGWSVAALLPLYINVLWKKRDSEKNEKESVKRESGADWVEHLGRG